MLQEIQNPSSHGFLHASPPDLLTVPQAWSLSLELPQSLASLSRPLAFRLRLSESLYLQQVARYFAVAFFSQDKNSGR